jgi:hypothetical protein
MGLIERFVLPLEMAGLDSYLVSGSVASIEYGEPRLTLDIDIAIQLEAAQLPILAALFPTPDFYCPPHDILALEISRQTRAHFNVIHLPDGLKADFYPSRAHPYFAWAWQNRRRLDIAGIPVWVAPPEYVILWKLEFFREGAGEKHRRDIRGMLKVSPHSIDRAFLDRAAQELALLPQWKACANIQ